MKPIKKIASVISAALFAAVISFSCNSSNGINEPVTSSNNATAKVFLKIADKSPSVSSFIPNYNEESAMSLSATLGKEFYPVKIGQKLTKTDENLTLVKDSTTATGTLVQLFEGTLIMKGTFQAPTYGIRTHVDTTIEKPFSTTITRNIQYEKVDTTGIDSLDWKIVGISLPAGGTGRDDLISIQKLTLETKDSVITIDNPSSYFFDVGTDSDSDKDSKFNGHDNGMKLGFGASFGWFHGWKKFFAWFNKNQRVTMTVEILSTSADPDVMTLTYGADMSGNFRTKEKFDLISSVQEGNVYRKEYQTVWKTHPWRGCRHAVINVLTRTSVYDSDSTVVEQTWGIPYKVN